MTDEERAALVNAAQQSMREPQQHARFILRSVLFGEQSVDPNLIKPDELNKLIANLIDDYTVDKLNRTGELISSDLLDFKQWVSDRYK